MVFFVCEACNETLKKNQVDKHTFKCRQCQAVTCVDCSVTFYGNDYAAHVTCISEAEKHEGSLYQAKKPKVSAQDSWVQLIEDAVTSAKEAPPAIQANLTKLGEFSNIPRNKKKFINFSKNSLRIHSEPALVALWDYLDGIRLKNATTATAPAPSVSNDCKTDSTTTQKAEETSNADQKPETKKRKQDESTTNDIAEEDKKTKKKNKKAKKEKEAAASVEVVETGNNIETTEVDLEKKAAKKAKKEKKAKKNNNNNY